MADDIKIIIGVDSAPVQRAVQLMNNLESEVRDVEKAEKKGLITRERAVEETKRLNVQMARLKQVSSGSAKDFYRFEKALVGSGKAARRNEVAIQQAGYQFQDFVVQVQGGVNPLIAFSQQGSQLAGFFAGPWGAAIGLGIAVLGSFGMALMTSIGTTKKFQDQIKDTTSTLDEYFNLMKSNSGVFSDVFEKNVSGLKLTSEAAKDLLAIAKIEAFKGIESLNASLTKSVLSASYLKTQIEDVGSLINQGFAAQVAASMGGKAGQEIRDLYDALIQLRESPTLEGQYEAALRAREIFKQNVDVTGELTDQQKAFWKEISQTIQQMELLGAAVETSESEVSNLADTFRAALANVRSDTTVVAENTISLTKNLGGSVEEAIKLQEALDQGKISASQLKGVDLEKGISPAVKAAKELAKQLGISFRLAAAMSGAIVRGADAEALDPRSPRYNPAVAMAARMKELMDSGDLYKDFPKTRAGTSGSGRAGQTNEEYLAQQLLEIKQKKNLIGLSQQELAVQKIYNDAQERGISLNDDRVKELVKEQKELNQLSEESDSYQQMIGGLRDNLTNAFESVLNGTKSVAGAFKDMVRQMLMSIAQKNFINPLVSGLTSGITSAVAGTAAAGTAAAGTAAAGTAAAGAAGAGGMMAGIGSTIGTAGAALVGGGMGTFGMTAAAGGTIATATAAMPAMAAIGAVAAPLLAVAAVFSFFKKKTKELDSGLNVTVKNMDTFVESFSKVQTKRFWGLSKKTSTNTSSASSEIANPVIEAASAIQNQVVKAAEALGVGANAFKNFSYAFKVSLKGLTEEQAMAEINKELTRMGDSFAALVPNIGSMAELTAVYQERLNLETRLLQLQGDTQALRKIELDSVNDYNKAILQQIYATEDAAAALNAANVVTNERLNLETRLLELQGDTQALRKIELASVNESNRALQQQIYAHEDAAESMRKLEEALNSLQESDFATMLDFQRARAAIRLGQPVANNLNAPTMPASSGVAAITTPMASTSAEIVQLRTEMKEMHKEAMFAYSKLIKNGKDSRDTLRSWDVVGLPPERTA